MHECPIDRWQRRARIAIWLQFVVILIVVAITLVERAELFRVYSDGVMIGYKPAWWFALWSALILATWGAFVLPTVSFVCAACVNAPLERFRALLAAILLGLVHIWLLLSAAQHAIL
jgi:hypothetical protein